MSSSTLNIVFMGTPAFAVPTLAALLQAGHHVIGVYSQPPRPSGRGHKVHKSPVHEFAENMALPVYTPTSLRDQTAQQALANLKPDAIVVAAYGLILPQAVLDIPVYGCFNVHASLLPRWRGAAPIQRALLAGDTETGVTIMQMEAGLDTGPMLLKGTIPITATSTATSLHDTLAEMGGPLMTKALEMLQAGTLVPMPQPTDGVTHAAKLTKEEGQLDWSLPADVLDRHIRALNPWPGTWCMVDDQRLKILAAVIKEGKPDGKPGTILDDHFTIQCGNKALQPTLVQRAGGAPLATEDYLHGHPIEMGTVLAVV